MPQKQNPVRAEALMALAPFVAGLAGQLEGSAVHLEERDGARWMMEWLLMPQLVVASGAALLTADQLVEGLLPQIDALHTNAIGETGLALAEQLSFALVPHVGRSDAQALVKRAAAQTRENGTPLVEALKALTDAPVNWEQLSDITAANRAAASACDLILAEIDTLTTPISISAAP